MKFCPGSDEYCSVVLGVIRCTAGPKHVSSPHFGKVNAWLLEPNDEIRGDGLDRFSTESDKPSLSGKPIREPTSFDMSKLVPSVARNWLSGPSRSGGFMPTRRVPVKNFAGSQNFGPLFLIGLVLAMRITLLPHACHR